MEEKALLWQGFNLFFFFVVDAIDCCKIHLFPHLAPLFFRNTDLIFLGVRGYWRLTSVSQVTRESRLTQGHCPGSSPDPNMESGRRMGMKDQHPCLNRGWLRRPRASPGTIWVLLESFFCLLHFILLSFHLSLSYNAEFLLIVCEDWILFISSFFCLGHYIKCNHP